MHTTLVAPAALRAPDPAAPATSLARFGLPDYHTAADRVLIERLAHADIVALGVLYSRHAARLFTMLRRVGPSDDFAQRVLCDIFLEIWRQHTAISGTRESSIDAVDDAAVVVANRALPGEQSEREDDIRAALYTFDGRDLRRPPLSVRRRLMTLLGHPHVEAEGARTHPARLGLGLLAVAALLSLTVLTGWWLLH